MFRIYFFLLFAYLKVSIVVLAVPIESEEDFFISNPLSNNTNLLVEQASLPLDSLTINQQKQYSVGTFLKVNWFHAQVLCSSRGLNLASINSAAENTQLQKYLIDNGIEEENFWLSGSNLAGQGRWFWVSNGKLISYRKWGPGEPNNGNGAENCLLKQSNGNWNDVNCEDKYFFICENRCPLNSYEVPNGVYSIDV